MSTRLIQIGKYFCFVFLMTYEQKNWAVNSVPSKEAKNGELEQRIVPGYSEGSVEQDGV